MARIQSNRDILKELGLLDFTETNPVQRPRLAKKKRMMKRDEDEYSEEEDRPDRPKRQRVTRSKGGATHSGLKTHKRKQPFKVDSIVFYQPEKKWDGGHVLGSIPGIEVGTHWETRMACTYTGVHRPPVAGISGNGEEGCFSIALSGGYEDDIDYGECFTCTHFFYNELPTSNYYQSRAKEEEISPVQRRNPRIYVLRLILKDQTLTRGNLALKISFENKTPVRVIRGYKLNSPFSPLAGYRFASTYSE